MCPDPGSAACRSGCAIVSSLELGLEMIAFTLLNLEVEAHYSRVILENFQTVIDLVLQAIQAPGKPVDVRAQIFFWQEQDRVFRPISSCKLVLSVDDAWKKIEAWRSDYDGLRSHLALGDLTWNSFGSNISEARNL